MIDNSLPQDASPVTPKEQTTKVDIFARNAAPDIQRTIPLALQEMRGYDYQRSEYNIPVAEPGVSATLLTRDRDPWEHLPGTTPDKLKIRYRDKDKPGRLRQVAVEVESSGLEDEPMLNLSSYDAAPSFPNALRARGVNDIRIIHLGGVPGNVMVYDGYTARPGMTASDSKGVPILMTHETTIVKDLDGEAFENGHRVEMEIDIYGSTETVYPNAVVYKKEGDDSWTRTYVSRNPKGSLVYPLNNTYVGEQNELLYSVRDIPLANEELTAAESLYAQAGDLGPPPDFSTVVGKVFPLEQPVNATPLAQAAT